MTRSQAIALDDKDLLALPAWSLSLLQASAGAGWPVHFRTP